MALSSIHDVTTHGNAASIQQNATHIDHHVVSEEHQFRPNPDAKPFFPINQLPMPSASGNWTFINENGKNINGIVPPQFWYNHTQDNENLVLGSANNPAVNKKQHIAFHLVSNVLDDEIPEEKDNINIGFPNSPRTNMFDNAPREKISGGWRTNTEPLNLPLEIVKNTAENNSINNKSIHEIWSPDPSPNGLNNVSPTEEINPYIINQQAQQQQQHQQQQQQQHQQQQQQHQQQNISKGSGVDSTDVSFENADGEQQQHQLQQQLHSNHQQQHQQTFSTGPIYEDVESERNESQSPSQYYYPPMYNQQYIYRGIPPPPLHSQRMPNMYPPVHHHGRENIMTRPMMYGPGNAPYYGHGPPPHYSNKFHPHHQNQRNDDTRYRTKQCKQQQLVYEIKLNYMEELGISLDECRDQLRHLERDYKKAEVTLSREFRLRKCSLGDGKDTSKYSSNLSGVDKLINDQQREHQKVESLIGRIERLGFTPMHPNVGVTLDLWLASIRDLRNTRKTEVASMNNGVHYGSKVQAQNDVCNLIECVKELAKHTRSARTVVWCAMQMLYAHSTSNSPTGD